MATLSNRQFRSIAKSRNGAMLVAVAVVMMMILIFSAFLIDVSWMALSKVELQSAVDEASRAALLNYAESDPSQSESRRIKDARKVARDIFQENIVGGKSRDVDLECFVFGHSIYSEHGLASFSAGATPYNSVQGVVQASNGTTSSISLFLAPIFGVNDFRPWADAIVGLKHIDIIVLTDASRSMTRTPNSPDEKGKRIHPPGGSKRKPPVDGSRWFYMLDALDIYVSEVQAVHQDAWIGLVSFGGGVSDAVKPIYPELELPSRREFELSCIQDDDDYLTESMRDYSDSPLGYGTDIAGALRQAMDMFASRGRTGSQRFILLLSDGAPWLPGGEPTEDVILAASQAGITIHSVVFGLYNQEANALMNYAADETGGKFFGNAESGDELEATIRDMAKAYPVRILD